MGKGDKKTKRGKIVNGSYGILRRRKKLKAKFEKPVITEVPKEIKTEIAVEKPMVKKAAVKKTTTKAAKSEEKEVKKTVTKKTTTKKPAARKTVAKPKKEEADKPKEDNKET